MNKHQTLKMDGVLIFIHSIMPIMYLCAALAALAKAIFVARYRAFDFAVIFLSFFKIYSISSFASVSSKRRKRYMQVNNLINLFLYALTALFFFMLIIYRGNVFHYS